MRVILATESNQIFETVIPDDHAQAIETREVTSTSEGQTLSQWATTLEPGTKVEVLDGLGDLIEDATPQLGVLHLSTAEHDRDLDLVTLAEELVHLAGLGQDLVEVPRDFGDSFGPQHIVRSRIR